MKLIIHKNIFNDIYLPHLKDFTKRYEIYYGGAGSGKSYFVAQKLVIKALTDRRKVLVLRKVGRTVKNSVFQLILDTLNLFQIKDKCKINKTDFSIELPNGSIFLCSGLDDPEKIKSIAGLTDAWLEEATEFTQDDFNQIDLRIRDPLAKDQQLILSFNPVSKASWCYLQFFAENPELDEFRSKVEIVKSNYTNNPHLPQAYVDSLLLLKATNPVYYGIYALGDFGSLDKLVYSNWQKFEFNKEDIKGDLIIGLDFGYTNDPTALVAAIVNAEENRIYVFKEWGGTGLLNDDIAKNIIDFGFAKSIIKADSAEQKSIDEIKRAGVLRISPCTKGQGSILQGIQKLQQYELIIHPDCKEILNELQNYAWEKDKQTNEYINKPIDKYNHYLDALRYALQCLDERVPLRSMDKKMLF